MLRRCWLVLQSFQIELQECKEIFQLNFYFYFFFSVKLMLNLTSLMGKSEHFCDNLIKNWAYNFAYNLVDGHRAQKSQSLCVNNRSVAVQYKKENFSPFPRRNVFLAMYLETVPILSVVEIKKRLGNSILLSATTLSHRVSKLFSRFVIENFENVISCYFF